MTDMAHSNGVVPQLIPDLLKQDRRVLLYGPPGVGKSVLATQLAEALTEQGRTCYCLSADPGSPAFGVPGAVTLARRTTGSWQIIRHVALCTLDAGRFRLPLVSAVRELARSCTAGVLLIDGPGVVRGVAGRELLTGLAEASDADLVLAVTRPDQHLPLAAELHTLAAKVVPIPASNDAKRPGKRTRARRRTAQWESYLDQAQEQTIDLEQFNCTGTPPPVEASSVWAGRQVALLEHNRTLAMGEVVRRENNRLVIRTPMANLTGDSLLIRDAVRTAEGVIESAEPFAQERLEFIPMPDRVSASAISGGPRIVGRVGAVDVELVNGVFGDPLLHLRFRHQRRSLLFDLGEGSRLAARVAHQVTDVCISHAHMDHISGFPWLLRSRLGEFPPCRLYGPPGLLRHITGFIQAYLWDRIGDRGPIFEVAELHGDRLRCYRLQVGRQDYETLDEVQVIDGILRKEDGFRIRAVQLDHHTPVLAFAYEPDQELNVRKDRLADQQLEPGPWLARLKQHLLAGNTDVRLTLPDGTQMTVGDLADELVLIRPGKKLVYATDLADTPSNRQRLVAFANHAHTLFCEAPFSDADADHAALHGHLTARACGEIATAAGVSRLAAFHFSRRYATDPEPLYDELRAACQRVVVPTSMRIFGTGKDARIPIPATDNSA